MNKEYSEYHNLTEKQESFAETLEIEPELESEQEHLPDVQKRFELSQQEAITAIASRAQYWGSRVEALKAQYAPLLEQINNQIKHAQQREERAKQFLTQMLPPGPDSELVTDTVRLYYRTTPVVEILSEDSVPFEFIKTVTSVDKQAVKRELMAGRQVEGCQLGNSYSLQIGVGGAKGKSLQKQRQKRLTKRTIEHGSEDGFEIDNGSGEISASSEEVA